MRSDFFIILPAKDRRGMLAIAARPRGGDWLDDEARAWRAGGFDQIVSLLTDDEVQELDLGFEADACRRAGLAFSRVPVPDRGLPPSDADFRAAARRLAADLASGRSILVHCRQGIGRSSLLAAAVIGLDGYEVDSALETIARRRGRPVPDTEEQRDWLLHAFSSAEARERLIELGGSDPTAEAPRRRRT